MVEGGRALLATLKERGIAIPSACGGRGLCGRCKVRVLDGDGDLTPAELRLLKDDERVRSMRLACQVKVTHPLHMEIPPELLKALRYRATVAALRDLTYDIKEVTLQLAPGERIDFQAGQFIQFEAPRYALTDGPVTRAYSIASSPSTHDRVELEVRHVPNGLCSTYIHRYLKVGDVVTINGPYGDFHLQDSGCEIICVAGGSGMAPIKSILARLDEKQSPRKIRYFFGARTESDLFLLDEMRAFERSLADFQFIPALSATGTGSAWRGETGLITEVLDRHVTSVENAEAYLCGSPGMINAAVAVLKGKGMPENRMYFDSFG